MTAEHCALSMALREVLPLRDLVQAMSSWSGLDEECLTTFEATAWEDNNSCWTLANSDPGQHAPRSRHFDSKVHWFRQHLLKPSKNPNRKSSDGVTAQRLLEVKQIDTSVQIADIFTKNLPPATFCKPHKLLVGW